MLDAEHFEATKALQNDCSTFMGKMGELNSLVQTYLEVLDKQVGMVLFEALTASCRSAMGADIGSTAMQSSNVHT